jgi:hypothetical protein
VFRRTNGDDFSSRKEEHAIRECSSRDFVFDQDEGMTVGAHLSKERKNLLSPLGVQIGRRFIQHKDARL